MKLKKQKQLFIWLAIVIVVVGFVTFFTVKNNQPGQLDDFASCIAQSGAKFYGAFWCPHCRNQKELFGNSARLLPYVECSTPDGNSQNITCTDKKIDSYPTWEFADGTRETGELTLDFLAEKTSCELIK